MPTLTVKEGKLKHREKVALALDNHSLEGEKYGRIVVKES